MDTLSPLAQKSNPQTYTIYALVGPIPVASTTWKDVRYIGMSVNPQYRFSQHLSCSDTTNREKNEWIRSLLVTGQMPVLHTIETVVGQAKAREREQYWIRYAMAQGADILNIAITYTEEERTEVHRLRAIRYAQIYATLERGTYVKRHTGNWYPSRLLDSYRRGIDERLRLIYLPFLLFKSVDGKWLDVADAPDAEFDCYIKQYIPVAEDSNAKWSWEERRDALEYATCLGIEVELQEGERPSKKRKKVKS